MRKAQLSNVASSQFAAVIARKLLIGRKVHPAQQEAPLIIREHHFKPGKAKYRKSLTGHRRVSLINCTWSSLRSLRDPVAAKAAGLYGFRLLKEGDDPSKLMFSCCTPYATALGASGDRPAALAELMRIIANGGLRMPVARIEQLAFAGDSPDETRLAYRAPPAERVLSAEIADIVRRSLLDRSIRG